MWVWVDGFVGSDAQTVVRSLGAPVGVSAVASTLAAEPERLATRWFHGEMYAQNVRLEVAIAPATVNC